MGISWARSSALFLFLSAPPAWAAGQLLLETSPPGASVTVDGRNVGQTPLLHEGLQAGAHHVTISRPGYRPLTFRVMIEHDLTTRHHLNLSPERAADAGDLLVESVPSGAEVYLNGRLLGRTPLHAKVRAGTHRLTLRRKGHEPAARIVKVHADLTSSQRISLAALDPDPPLVAEAPLPPASPPTPDPTPVPTPEPSLKPTSKPSPPHLPRPTPAPMLTAGPTPRPGIAPFSRNMHVSKPPSRPPAVPAARPRQASPLVSAAPSPARVAPEQRPEGPAFASLPEWRLPAWRLPTIPRPQWPELPWEDLPSRLWHAGFSLMMLGFVATLGRAVWKRRPMPLEWQPDMPASGFHPLTAFSGAPALLAARFTLSGIARAHDGAEAEACADFREAYRLAPSAASAYNLALAWERAAELDWAEIAYRTAFQLDRDHRDAGFNLAALLVSREKPLEALVLYRYLVSRHPEDGAIAFNHANLLAACGQLALAASELERARRQLPHDPAPWVNLRLLRRRIRAQFWARALRRGRPAR